MLCIKLKIGDSCHIGDNISVMLLRSCGTSCHVGIEAPRELEIVRDVHLERAQDQDDREDVR